MNEGKYKISSVVWQRFIQTEALHQNPLTYGYLGEVLKPMGGKLHSNDKNFLYDSVIFDNEEDLLAFVLKY